MSVPTAMSPGQQTPTRTDRPATDLFVRADLRRQLERTGRTLRHRCQLAEDLLDRADRVVDVAREDRSRIDGLEFEGRHDAEVAAAAAKGPEQVRIAVRTGHDLLAGRGHHLGTDEVVAGEPAKPRQPADPAAERQPADPCVDDGPADHREVVPPRRGVDVLPERPAVDAHDPRRRVDRDRAPIPQVDDQGAVGHRVPGDAVPATADRDRKAEVARRHDRRDHIVVVADADDDRRPPLDRGVEGRPRPVVVGVVRRGDALVERGAQAVDDELFHHHPRAYVRAPAAGGAGKQATWKGQVYTLGRASIPAAVRREPIITRGTIDPSPRTHPRPHRSRSPPTVPILPNIQGPADLRGLDEVQLAQLAVEIRDTIVRTVASTGGHLGSSLGVVELTIALHRLLESPRDRIVWDTGHQAYPHKLLTGRLERFGTLRQLDGVGGFPRRSESPHDVFDGGHAGTGPVDRRGPRRGARPAPRPRADRGRRRRRGADERALARGAQRHRPAPDADADRGQRQRDVDQPDGRGVLDVPVARSSCRGTWRQSKSAYDRTVERIPVVGPHLLRAVASGCGRRSCSFAQPGQLFEDLGITYIGVVPGHDLHALLVTLEPRAGAAGADDRPRPDPEGPRLPAGRDRPGRLPRGGAAADRRWRRRPTRTTASRTPMPTESMADDAAPPARGRDDGDEEPELHGGLRRRAHRARPDRSAHRRDHGRACRPGPGCPSSRPSSRTGCSTSASPSSTRWRWRRAWRWAGCGRSSRSTRRSSSAPSTRPSTTSARTTSRC